MVRSEPTGRNMPLNRTGFTRLDAEWHDVVDLEIDGVAYAHAVQEAVVVDLDGGALDAQHLAHQGSQGRHRATKLPAEDLRQLVELVVACPLVDLQAEAVSGRTQSVAGRRS
jgi:hypothetical protein